MAVRRRLCASTSLRLGQTFPYKSTCMDDTCTRRRTFPFQYKDHSVQTTNCTTSLTNLTQGCRTGGGTDQIYNISWVPIQPCRYGIMQFQLIETVKFAYIYICRVTIHRLSWQHYGLIQQLAGKVHLISPTVIFYSHYTDNGSTGSHAYS